MIRGQGTIKLYVVYNVLEVIKVYDLVILVSIESYFLCTLQLDQQRENLK